MASCTGSGAAGLGPPDWDHLGINSIDRSSLGSALEFLFEAPDPMFWAAAAVATPEIQSLLDPNNTYVKPEGPPTTWGKLLEKDEDWWGRKFRFKPE
jgi:hypothetical protein